MNSRELLRVNHSLLQGQFWNPIPAPHSYVPHGARYQLRFSRLFPVDTFLNVTFIFDTLARFVKRQGFDYF